MIFYRVIRVFDVLRYVIRLVRVLNYDSYFVYVEGNDFSFGNVSIFFFVLKLINDNCVFFNFLNIWILRVELLWVERIDELEEKEI